MTAIKATVTGAAESVERFVLSVRDTITRSRSSNCSEDEITSAEKIEDPASTQYDYSETNGSCYNAYCANYDGSTCFYQHCYSDKLCCSGTLSCTDILKALLGCCINLLCYPFLPCAIAFLPASFQFAGYTNTNSLYPCYGKTCCFCVRSQDAGLCKVCCSPMWLLLLISVILVTVFILVCNQTQNSAVLIQVLLYFQNLNEVVLGIVFVVLFTAVSFPMLWGYIILNLAAGYIYGFWLGLCVVVFSVVIGITITHLVCKKYFASCVMNLLRKRSNFDQIEAILQVIDGSSGLKIIMLTRLTPIPFGFQNGLFAVSSVSLKYYLLASAVGLLPTQMLNCYIASKFRSMEQIIEQNSSKNYLFFTFQIAVGIGLMMFVVQKARKELAIALQNNSKTLSDEHLLREPDPEESIQDGDEPLHEVKCTQPSSVLSSCNFVQ